VDAVEGEDDHHDEVGDEDRDVEGVPAVVAVEGGVEEALPVGFGGEEERERVEGVQQKTLRGRAMVSGIDFTRGVGGCGFVKSEAG
jgi:hypothetical protein